MNYKLTLAYDGTKYRGWQVQGNTDQTIQGKLEQVLSRREGSPVEVHGSGRTDAGVHARGQAANVHLKSAPSPEELQLYLCTYLPKDIAVLKVETCPDRFHARLNAVSKCYTYRLWTSPVPNVFERNFLTSWEGDLDLEAMKEAASYLIGEHDFRSFCGLRKFKKSTVRRIESISIDRIGDEVRISYVGNGFLNLMVRILTGTLVEVGQGERTPSSVRDALAALNRDAAGMTMPPQGLCLDWVKY